MGYPYLEFPWYSQQDVGRVSQGYQVAAERVIDLSAEHTWVTRTSFSDGCCLFTWLRSFVLLLAVAGVEFSRLISWKSSWNASLLVIRLVSCTQSSRLDPAWHSSLYQNNIHSYTNEHPSTFGNFFFFFFPQALYKVGVLVSMDRFTVYTQKQQIPLPCILPLSFDGFNEVTALPENLFNSLMTKVTRYFSGM